MKKLLTIVLIATFSLSLGAISFAQDAGPQGGQLQKKRGPRPGVMRLRAKIQSEVLASLDLNADQKKQIDDLNKDIADKFKDIQQQNKGTEGNKNLGAQQRNAMKDYNDKLHTILGDDLWRQYREGMLAKMKEYRERRKEREQENTGAKPPAN